MGVPSGKYSVGLSFRYAFSASFAFCSLRKRTQDFRPDRYRWLSDFYKGSVVRCNGYSICARFRGDSGSLLSVTVVDDYQFLLSG